MSFIKLGAAAWRYSLLSPLSDVRVVVLTPAMSWAIGVRFDWVAWEAGRWRTIRGGRKYAIG